MAKTNVRGTQILDSSVDLAVDVTGQLPMANLAATGTPDSTTFLRGDGVWAVGSSGSPSVYTTTIGNGSSTSFLITHNLGTRSLTVTVYDAATYEVVTCDRSLTSTNTCTLTFATAPATGAYAVVVLGGALLSNPSVFTQTIGNGSSTSFVITHNLGTRSVNVNVYDASTYKMVWPDRELTSTNTCTLTFSSAPATNAYVVVVQGGINSSGAVDSTNITDATAAGRALLTGTSVTSNVVMAEMFDSGTLKESATLPASTDFSASQQMEIGSTSVLEIPSSASLEILTYGGVLTSPMVSGYAEAVTDLGIVSSAATLSIATSTVIVATLTASTACTFTMPQPGAGKSFVLLLKQALVTGSGTATFTGVKWNSSGAPTITATAAKMDVLTFVSDGINWYGSYSQGYTP